MEGDTLIDAIRTLHAEARIIVNTMHEEVWVVKTMQEKQVDAVIYKSTDLSQLLHAIRAVSQGSKYFCPQFRRDSQRTAPPLKVSPTLQKHKSENPLHLQRHTNCNSNATQHIFCTPHKLQVQRRCT